MKLLKNKALFSSFCMVWNNLSNYSVLFKTFFQALQRHPIFKFTSVAKQRFNLQGKKVTENKLKSSDYEFNILPCTCQNEFQICNTSKQNFCGNSCNYVLAYFLIILLNRLLWRSRVRDWLQNSPEMRDLCNFSWSCHKKISLY